MLKMASEDLITIEDLSHSERFYPTVKSALPSNLKVIHHPDMKNIRLTTHQLIDITAMTYYENCIDDPYEGGVHCGVLSEPFGSGKTLIIIGLIIANPTPLPRNYVTYYNSSFTTTKYFNKVLRPTLIFCGSNVTHQWKDAIIKSSHLKLFVIMNIYDLKEFDNLVKTNGINLYDCVVIKNGTITKKFPLDGYVEKVSESNHADIYNLVKNISVNEGVAWKRLIIDDLDTISIPSHFTQMPALFTWIVSGSVGRIKLEDPDEFNLHEMTVDDFDHCDYGVHNRMHIGNIRDTLDIHCEKEFTEMCVDTARPKFYLYLFDNPNDYLIGMIGNLNGDNIMEMLNGDAIHTAAREAGVIGTSVADIFEKILGREYARYTRALANIEYTENARCVYPTLPHVPTDDEGKVTKFFTEDNFVAHHRILYKFQIIPELIATYLPRYMTEKNTAGIAIDRVKSNISEMGCAICCTNLDMETTVIHRCCGNITCGDCCISVSRFLKDGKNNDLCGVCSKCGKSLKFSRDIIILDPEFDLDKLLKDELTYDEEAVNKERREAEQEAARIASEQEAARIVAQCESLDVKMPETKLDVLIQLIKLGTTVYPRKDIMVDVGNLLVGNREFPDPKPEDRRFVVCTAFEEIVENIFARCAKEGITVDHLQGSAGHMANIINAFEKGEIKVLILNQNKHAGGLNLQFATDLIFIQKMINPELEKQVLGRLQRYGRTTSANIHILVYHNEVKSYSICN